MMNMGVVSFDWDQGNVTKIKQRLIATGLGPKNKPMFVCFTIRSEKIRVISARFMKANEAKRYEEFKKKYEE